MTTEEVKRLDFINDQLEKDPTITDMEIAKRLGITRQALSKWCKRNIIKRIWRSETRVEFKPGFPNEKRGGPQLRRQRKATFL